MKILLVHPGADWSVADVHNGYGKALARAGHDVRAYNLSGRITAAAGYLNHAWKLSHLGRDKKPSDIDTLYLAGAGIIERALRHEVDWVLLISGTYVMMETLVLLRRAGRKIAILLTESPYDIEREMALSRHADVIFTMERTAVEKFREECGSVHYLRHAYDPDTHKPFEAPEGTPAHDVVFVATGFIERCKMLAGVDWTGIDFGLYGSWDLLGSRNKVRKHIGGELLYNEQTAAMYQRAKIGLNIHRSSVGFGRHTEHIEHAESVNPRVIELAACKTFQLSDWREEMGDIFDWVPTYTNAGELEEQIRHYLASPDEREEITEQMYQEVQGETFDARVPTIEKALRET